MRNLTTKTELDESTFCPQVVFYLDSKKTKVRFSIEAIQDGATFHGDVLYDVLRDAVINELNSLYKLSEEESSYYNSNFKDIISNSNFKDIISNG